MFGEKAIPFYLIVGVAVTLAIGSTFTPVIARSGAEKPKQADVANMRQELSYCHTNLEDVNCACFAGIAGHILSSPKPDFRGTDSMDRVDLARFQAAKSC